MDRGVDLILANRAFLDHSRPPREGEPPRAESGGLLAAVRPAIIPWDGASGTTWVGAGRGPFDAQYTDDRGYELLPTVGGELRHRRLYFDDAAWAGHYAAVANSFFWPLLHLVRVPLPLLVQYYPRPATPLAADWAAYVAVNERFAAAALEEEGVRHCWVHDYQLALVPALLRQRGFDGRVAFFLHTPFPDVEVASLVLDDGGRRRLGEFVAGILGADLVGVQSDDDRRRFVEAAVRFCGASVSDNGVVVDGRAVRIGAYPVGVDAEDVLAAAAPGSVPAPLAGVLSTALPLVVGLERSDFTKGIPERLSAIASLFESGSALAYAGVAAPTRDGVPAYGRLDAAIEQAAGRATQGALTAGAAFRHLHQAIPWPEVVGLQARAAVVCTTSLADGMNLVPLQAALAQSLRPPAERATILVGRDAGVARAYSGFEADGLVAVDPLDAPALETAIRRAAAGQLPRVSDRLIAEVRRRDARRWAADFLNDLDGCPC